MVVDNQKRFQPALPSNQKIDDSKQAGIIESHQYRSLLSGVPASRRYPIRRLDQLATSTPSSLSSAAKSRSLRNMGSIKSKRAAKVAHRLSQVAKSTAQTITHQPSVPAARKRKKETTKSSVIDPKGFEVYFRDPANHPNVISCNKDFIIVNDIYPKATIHLLVLPRDPTKRKQHPFDAFKDSGFLDMCRKEVPQWGQLAAERLKDAICTSEAVLHCDWEAEISVGIHSRPSMEDLHIHVISRDLHSKFLWEKTNYTSFTTSFFVGLEEFPLEDREEVCRVGALEAPDLVCWRCHKTFRSFYVLKEHLEDEFDSWKAELVRQQVQNRWESSSL